MNLEARIGCNPMMIFSANGNRIPTITEMIHVLHNSLTQYNHGITFDKATEIFDDWLADGHTPTDFIHIIIKIYRVSGIMAREDAEEEEEDTEKN